MTENRNNVEELVRCLEKSVSEGSFRNIVFHSPYDRNGDSLKAKGTLKNIGGRDVIQMEIFLTEGRVRHENIGPESFADSVGDHLKTFRNTDLNTVSGSVSLMTSKKGKSTLIRNTSKHAGEVPENGSLIPHNDRIKDRMLQGNERFLIMLGISDPSGRVRDKKQSKFRQICRFSEYIREAESRLPRSKTLDVYDLCCGKSYLSFAAYHVLTEICRRDVRMTCVDLKKSVMEECSTIAEKCGFANLRFICADVSTFRPENRPDLVLSLHACDTATDMVLKFASENRAEVILSTPCCHHKLNREIDCPPLSFITSRPILRQKLCDSATDSLRLLKLEAEGYRTDATELIDPDETPKNVLLRAYRNHGFDPSSPAAGSARKRYDDTYRFLYGHFPDSDLFRIVPANDNTKGNNMDIRLLETAIGNTATSSAERLSVLRDLKKLIDSGEIPSPEKTSFVNNHIHTCYSFSPYTPSSAVYFAWKAGLSTAGIMDHDSVAGFREFIEAGRIMEMPITCGFECRANVDGTILTGRKINNPDQASCAYLAMHGIPHQNIGLAEEILSPLREKRNERNRRMCCNINGITREYGIELDFDKDVVPLSMSHEGGSITERHICFALTKKITGKYPDREEAIAFLGTLCGAELPEKTRRKLLDAPDEYYEFDILGVLKSSLVGRFYVNADEECMNIRDFTSLAKRLGAISAYAYLGDVGESPTGDKKAQKFEDDYLDELFTVLKECGFSGVTYMPSRNTKEQLKRVMSLCEANGLFQISGEDINSPRQSFICRALEDPDYSHLRKATYALIGHEKAASTDIDDSMFSDKTINEHPVLSERIDIYSRIGGYSD